MQIISDKKLIGDSIPWLKKLRDESLHAFKLPKPKDEAWKYTKLNHLSGKEFRFSDKPENSKLNLKLFDAYVVLFINGIFNPFQSHFPEGVEICPLIEYLSFDECDCKNPNSEPKITTLKEYPFAVLNSAYLQEGLFINITEKFEKPLVVLNYSDKDIFYNLTNIINVNADAEVVEIFMNENQKEYFGNIVNRISIGKDANLKH